MSLAVVNSKIRDVWRAMRRSKPLSQTSMATPLNRCLTVFDLTLLGIGNMAGSGIYVLTGTVVREKAGPATFLSYLIAGVTAFLNAICYAELGSRIPKAGSAYTYTYIASGEFLAFIIGWSVILEYVLSVASVARGWSGIVDKMTNDSISQGTERVFGKFPADNEFLGDYPDFIGLLLVLFLGLVLSRGPKLSVNLNSAVTILNLIVISLTCVLMYTNKFVGSDFAPASQGGFLPHGFGGMIAGAGTCFYAFIGFDAITVSCEEALDPRRALPVASAVSVSLVTVLFVITSGGLVSFQNWWEIDRTAAFTAAFKARGMAWAGYITGFGSILGLTASLFTSMYAMPRIVYAMAGDGLLPSWLGYVTPSTQVPVVALAIFGALSGILTFLCDIHTLADFLSIGTLMAYTIACMNVCILRYLQPHLFEKQSCEDIEQHEAAKTGDCQQDSDLHEQWPHTIGRLKSAFRHLPILRSSKPGHAPLIALMVFVIASSVITSLLLPGSYLLSEGSLWAWLLLVFAICLAVLSILIMVVHEQNVEFDTFKVPLVPILPCLSIFLNLCLIVKLSAMTWVRFFVWLLIGFVIYFGYGLKHSTLANSSCGEADTLLANGSQATDNTPNAGPADDKANNTHYKAIDESDIAGLVSDAMKQVP